ncbi:MAG: RIP metalloprotease RseP [Bacteroidales bacterium]|nr:RIP metalloprotease RseP [Bacteroidales bacterium]
MDTLIKIGQLLLSLSLLIVLHELGHFIFARIFKTRVEKFYLFFNPWFSLFKLKKGETEYGIGWLPLGGYVKISGMLDESMDKEQLKQPPQPHEFRSKKSWQRLLIMLGGVIVNFILAFVLYTIILFGWGETYLPVKNMTGGVWVTDSILTATIGLQTGDKIISINGEQPERYNQIVRKLLKEGELIVERNGERVSLQIPRNMPGILSENSIKSKKRLLSYRFPWVVDSVMSTSQNISAGLQRFDKIVGVNGQEHLYFDEYMPIMDTLKGKEAIFQVQRGGQIVDIALKINNEGKVGVYPSQLPTLDSLGHIKLVEVKYGLFKSVPAGFKFAMTQLIDYIDDFKLILDFKSGAHKGMGGFAAIGGLFPATWDWLSFWEITAFLSLMLAFLNVLPIPALDGGHVMFLLFEMVTGRKPGEKFMEYAQIAGMAILFFLLIYANGNDIYRWIMGMKG